MIDNIILFPNSESNNNLIKQSEIDENILSQLNISSNDDSASNDNASNENSDIESVANKSIAGENSDNEDNDNKTDSEKSVEKSIVENNLSNTVVNSINSTVANDVGSTVDNNNSVITMEEKQIADASTGIKFKIENFEGPLDLLLHLIKKSKLEIEDIKLSEITEQYLKIMEQIDSVDLETASEFIEVAATLIEIKSKALLPKLIIEEDEEEDSELLLMQRLQEYKLFKEASEQLKPLENVERFYKKPEPEANKFRVVIKDMSYDMLLSAFTDILMRVTTTEKNSKPKEVSREVFTISSKIAAIKDALIVKEKVNFSEFFSNSSSRNEVITIFLAILELLKVQEIKCKQSDIFDDIEIVKVEENNG